MQKVVFCDKNRGSGKKLDCFGKDHVLLPTAAGEGWLAGLATPSKTPFYRASINISMTAILIFFAISSLVLEIILH